MVGAEVISSGKSGIPMWIVLSLFLSFTFLLPMISGAVVLFTEGDWKPLAQASVGRIADANKDIYDVTLKLEDVKANPQNYDSFDTDAMWNRIALNFGILFLMFYLLYKFFTWEKLYSTLGYNSVGFVYVLVVIFLSILIISIGQFAWTGFENKAINNYSWEDTYKDLDLFNTHKDIPFYAPFNFIITSFSDNLWDVKGTKNQRG